MGIVDWIYPKRCVGCGEEGSFVCKNCRQTIEVKGNGLAYEGVVRKLLKEIKYRGTHAMIGELVDIWIEKLGGMEEEGVVTSVPMWRKKRRERGFNQAELIARELAMRLNKEYIETLRRVRSTKPMYGLTRKERRANVSGAFEVNGEVYKFNNRQIILVDDVWTTGATCRECERVLRVAGVLRVKIITMAR